MGKLQILGLRAYNKITCHLLHMDDMEHMDYGVWTSNETYLLIDVFVDNFVFTLRHVLIHN